MNTKQQKDLFFGVNHAVQLRNSPTPAAEPSQSPATKPIEPDQPKQPSENSQSDYKGLPLKSIAAKWLELNGGEPQQGERNTVLFELATRMRYITEFNPEIIAQNIPHCGLSNEEVLTLCKSACTTQRSTKMPSDLKMVLKNLVNDAVELRNSPNPEKAPEKQVPREITAEMIPQGDDARAMKERQRLIQQFYTWWGSMHPDKKVYNDALKEDIYVSYRSKQETSRHAAKKFELSLAVLHLDEILKGALPVLSSKADPATKSQSKYERIILMKYIVAGIGVVKLSVGVFKKTQQKEQYCMTVIEADAANAFRPSERHKKGKKKTDRR